MKALLLAALMLAQEPADTAEDAFERARIAYALNDFASAQIAAAEAAGQGHVEAMTLLGFMNERGLGGIRDMGKALSWYRAAARENEPDALMALAAFAVDAQYGLTPADARDFLSRAVQAGRPEAGLELARLYLEGFGGPPDREAALQLLRDGSTGEDSEAAFRAGVILADTGAADEEAAAYLLEAAEAGHAMAATLYGHALYNGTGVAEDKPAAAAWYETAAERGDAEGQVYHALILAGVEGDLDGAAYWLERSRISDADAEGDAPYEPLRQRLTQSVSGVMLPDDYAAAKERARADAAA